jgi:hypothetical protein
MFLLGDDGRRPCSPPVKYFFYFCDRSSQQFINHCKYCQSWTGAIRSLTLLLTTFLTSLPFIHYDDTYLQHKPHIAYLLCLSMDLSVTYFNIVRGRKNQRPRQPVPSTLLALIKCARRTNQDKQILLTVLNVVF